MAKKFNTEADKICRKDLRSGFVRTRSSFKRFREAGKVSDEIIKELLKEVIVYPHGRLEVVWKYQDTFITA